MPQEETKGLCVNYQGKPSYGVLHTEVLSLCILPSWLTGAKALLGKDPNTCLCVWQICGTYSFL